MFFDASFPYKKPKLSSMISFLVTLFSIANFLASFALPSSKECTANIKSASPNQPPIVLLI